MRTANSRSNSGRGEMQNCVLRSNSESSSSTHNTNEHKSNSRSSSRSNSRSSSRNRGTNRGSDDSKVSEADNDDCTEGSDSTSVHGESGS